MKACSIRKIRGKMLDSWSELRYSGTKLIARLVVVLPRRSYFLDFWISFKDQSICCRM